jgi:hypothetical protein
VSAKPDATRLIPSRRKSHICAVHFPILTCFSYLITYISHENEIWGIMTPPETKHSLPTPTLSHSLVQTNIYDHIKGESQPV